MVGLSGTLERRLPVTLTAADASGPQVWLRRSTDGHLTHPGRASLGIEHRQCVLGVHHGERSHRRWMMLAVMRLALGDAR